MSSAGKASRVRMLGGWEGRLYDLMREIEEHSHLVGCSDLHSMARLTWKEATRTREGEENRLEDSDA